MVNSTDNAMVHIDKVVRHFPVKSSLAALFSRGQAYIRAVDNVSLEIREREILGLAGESGCGKSTLGRLLALLDKPTQGVIRFEGTTITEMLEQRQRLKEFRKKVQMILQDPYESLDPRYTVHDAISEPLKVHGIRSASELHDRIEKMVQIVGLSSDDIRDKYPHELSGGQRQRVSIARAMVLEPKFVIADEAVSMLDVSVRAGILTLFDHLRQQFGVTCLFISHDIAVVRHLCDRIAIMYMGKIVEVGTRDEIIHAPIHPYTTALISAVPVPDPRHKRTSVPLGGEIPDALRVPPGCRFHPRCRHAEEICRSEEPELRDKGGRWVACFR
jgi:oligopeptide/dipeptide ABC transporter ATP-binding protein